MKLKWKSLSSSRVGAGLWTPSGNGYRSASLLVLLFAGLQGCASSPAEPAHTVNSDRGIQAYQSYVYPYLRTNCASCHATRSPQVASEDVSQAYQASKANVNFTALESSKLVAKARDGHCGARCSGDVSELLSGVQKWAAQEATPTR